jgi:hypothetical protein
MCLVSREITSEIFHSIGQLGVLNEVLTCLAPFGRSEMGWNASDTIVSPDFWSQRKGGGIYTPPFNAENTLLR